MTSYADRVQETTSTTGTGTISLNGATSGYQAFSSAFASGIRVDYCITDGSNWEVGNGIYTIGTPSTIQRNTILSSSNSNNVVNFTSATMNVFNTQSAARVGIPLSNQTQIASVTSIGFPGVIVASFVYDTKKDSDGGVWRERCQGTSWYSEVTTATGNYLGVKANEAAARAVSGATTGDYFYNTASSLFVSLNAISGVSTVYRGARQKFPEVVGITAEANRVILWDLTDSSCPPFMVFTAGASTPIALLANGRLVTSTTAINGKVIIGQCTPSSDGWVLEISFITDMFRRRGYGASTDHFYSQLSLRNNGMTLMYNTVASITSLLGYNSVAATVLPNAPIDPTTGLPVPTIALGSGSGVSVITDSGSVFNITCSNSTYTNAQYVSFTPDNHIMYSLDGTGEARMYRCDLIPSSNVSITINVKSPSLEYYVQGGYNADLSLYPISQNGGALFKYAGDAWGLNFGTTSVFGGITRLRRNPSNPSTGMLAYISNTFNSGYLNGDIRLATLSSTVVETVSGASLVTGDSSNFNGGTVGSWVASYQSTIAVVNSQLVITSTATNPYATLAVPVVIGDTYIVSIDSIAKTAGVTMFNLILGNVLGLAQSQYGSAALISLATGNVISFTATTTVLNVQIVGVCGIGDSMTIDNLSVVPVAADRSVKQNPLNVIGTLSKTNVNTGSQLVSYSGFSASNYLQQSYSSNLDFSSDFSINVWVNPSLATQTSTIITRSPATLALNSYALNLVSGVLELNRSIAGAAYSNTTFGYTPNISQWTLITIVKTLSVISLYANGIKQSTTIADTNSYVNNTALLTVGVDYSYTSFYTGALSLLRISATAPSADQIAYIYESERKLFETNALCCVQGTSNAITALDYDDTTDLLSVGTTWGTTDFKGLRVSSSAATSVGAIAALSAKSGYKILSGTTSSFYEPARYLSEEIARVAAQRAGFGSVLVTSNFTATAAQTAFIMPSQIYIPQYIYVNGLLKTLTADYTLAFDGFRYTINLVSGVLINTPVTILSTRNI